MRTLIGLLASLVPVAVGAASLPVAPVKPVTDDYYGTQVTDNYRYFEESGNAVYQQWMKAQAEYTRSVLDGIPGRKALLDRITVLDAGRVTISDVVQRGERYFYQKRAPNEQTPKLYYRDGLEGSEHLLFDPAARVVAGTHFSLDFYAPSWDGHLVAYGVSSGGSEESVLHVLDVTSGHTYTEAIDRTGDSVVSWLPDNQSFFYLRYNKPTSTSAQADRVYNARTYLHRLGQHVDGDEDVVVFGRGVAKALEVPEGQGTYVIVAPDSRYAIAVANHNMDNAPATLFVAPLASIHGAATPWHKIADVEDGIGEFHIQGNTLYFLTSKNSPRFRIARTPLAHPDVAHGTVLLQDPHAVITGFAMAADALYAGERAGAVTRLVRLTLQDGQSHPVPSPFEGTAAVEATDPRRADALFSVTGWIHPDHLYHYDPQAQVSRDTGWIPEPRVDTSNLEVEEVLATSYDGTRVPLSIVHQRDLVRGGHTPTLLFGYGSYGNSYDPYFSAILLAWLERGGIMAVAHVRGGGEYGEDWHKGGQKLTKLNTVFDFIACAQYLVDQRYTSPKYLAGQGASAGGVTVGGALTWRPDLFAVILDIVGMTDTLRVETTPNGPPNISEFGSVKTEEGFHGLYAMSAYARVRDGTPYPAVLLATGANDPRVAPWIIAKMAARLQAATSSGKPILLDVDYDAGHGIGSQRDQIRRLLADEMTFALWQFGEPGFQPK
jgi:prolyl oligopeptidase